MPSFHGRKRKGKGINEGGAGQRRGGRSPDEMIYVRWRQTANSYVSSSFFFVLFLECWKETVGMQNMWVRVELESIEFVSFFSLPSPFHPPFPSSSSVPSLLYSIPPVPHYFFVPFNLFVPASNPTLMGSCRRITLLILSREIFAENRGIRTPWTVSSVP